MNEILPFGERYLSGSFEPPLRHHDVRRLALEGGGGKGNAYLGALFALDQLGVLGRLETVAGSSAGAITALAISLGMKPHEVFRFMATTDFGKFFDQPSDAIPAVGKPYDRPPSSERTKRSLVLAAWAYETRTIHLLGQIFAGLKKARVGWNAGVLQALLIKLFSPPDVRLALIALQPERAKQSGAGTRPPEPLTAKVVDQLLTALPDYLTSLSLDTGIFSGETARETLGGLISAQLGAKGFDPREQRSQQAATLDGRTVTFADLDRFCKDYNYPLLRVTGSEMCSLRTVIFSGRSTPNFPVADAVRISMGLPFVYKPYTIRSTGSGQPPCGVYVDGGVFSNLPLLAYSDDEAATALGLRLEIDTPTKIEGTLGFIGQVAQASLLAGESSVVTSRAERSVRLDTHPLGLFDFTADRSTLETVSTRAHLTTMLFFGQGTSYVPVNIETGAPLPDADAAKATKKVWEDLRTSVERRRAAGGCVYGDPA